jgi:tol-pal system protein YbgF
MMRLNKGLAVAAAGILMLGLTSARAADGAIVVAQGYNLPPGEIGRGGQDEASLLVRLERLENQVRQLNGQLEQMQFENRKLEEQLRKFQQDVDFRLQEGRGKPPKRTELETPPATTVPSTDAPATVPSTTPRPGGRRADAFDPLADPNAPGVPHQLGGTAPVAPTTPGQVAVDDTDPNAPLELSSSPERAPHPAPVPAGPGPTPVTTPLTTPGGTVIATTAPNAPPVNPVKEEFDVALGYFKQKEYDNAEKNFAAFIQKNPKTRYSAEAVYYLGESYYLRGRQREAAEQYLKISTDYANSSRAPEALIRLGQSLNALGAKEQACASFSEVGRKYPNASAAVKAAAEREAKRLQCG